VKKDALWMRANVVTAVRNFFAVRGFLEVETPALIPANAPEEHINPVVTLPWQLQTSPELCMKRLLCRGYERLFQISRCWRNGERGIQHLPEFTMLEWYRSGRNYNDLMTDCEELLQHIARECIPDRPVYCHNSLEIDPFTPWQRMSLSEAFVRFANINVRVCLEKGLYEDILSDVVEPALSKFSSPVFLYDFPVELAALSRVKPDDSDYAERFELYVGGLELANAFSELNDPQEQRKRFEEVNLARAKAGQATMQLPERFLAELETMPPSAGIALGVDRLIMLVTGAESIDQVVAFTPEDL